MRTFTLLSAAICLGFAVAAFPRSDPGKEKDKDPQAERITALIRELGHDEFAKREAATKALVALGDAALPALRHASDSRDYELEIRRTAKDVIRIIMPTFRVSKATNLELRLIAEGTFEMGSPKNEANRRPDELLHKVKISRPFYLGSYEVTQEEFKMVTKTNPSWFAATGPGKDAVWGMNTTRFPVERVTWFDAVEFCNLLSKLDDLPPFYKIEDVKRTGTAITAATVTVVGGKGYRLPTEAEWEYACRGGTSKPFHYGDQNTGREANIKAILVPAGYGMAAKWRDLGRTAKVGSYASNGPGLFDMHGNVAEWCQDWYDADYYVNSPAADPKGPEKGLHRVLRSGSWLVNEGSCRAASRLRHLPGDHHYYAGFRIARNP